MSARHEQQADGAPLRVLFLTRYDRLGASSRQRCFLYQEALRAAGIAAEVSPFLGDGYLRRRYAGGRPGLLRILGCYLRRLAALLRARRYDLVWIEKEALPWLPASCEGLLLKLAGAPVVVDYDDATFHLYDRHANPLVQRLLRGKIGQVMRAAQVVAAGNAYLAAHARAAGARQVIELPTVVDLRRYPAAPRPPQAGWQAPFLIGWIGSPVTSPYLDLLRPALVELAARVPFRLMLIGAAPDVLSDFPAERIAWSAEDEAAQIARCDVGVMPLPDRPWERGKCGYKLIQFMACWLPVVASPIGANCDILRPGETGFLAGDPAQWGQALTTLAGDPGLRDRLGRAGRRRVEALYSLEFAAPRFLALLRGAAAGVDAPATGGEIGAEA